MLDFKVSKLKKGEKLRYTKDDSIWEVSKIIDKDHVELTCVSKVNKKGQGAKRILASTSLDFSKVLNSFEYETVIVIKHKVYANTKEEADTILKNHFNEIEEEIIDYLPEELEFELKKENIIK